MTRPLSAIECYRAAERLMGGRRRTTKKDVGRDEFVQTWAAWRCPDISMSRDLLGIRLGENPSVIQRRSNIVENHVALADREELRRCIREDALRERDGKRGSAPAELVASVRSQLDPSRMHHRVADRRFTPEFARSVRQSCLSARSLAAFFRIPVAQVLMIRDRRTLGWVDDVQDDGIVQG